MEVLIDYAGCDGFDKHTLVELEVQVWISDHRFEVQNP